MSQNISLGVVMDPIESIHPEKDTTLALLLQAQSLGWHISYMEMKDLHLREGRAFGDTKVLTLFDDLSHWYEFGETETKSLDKFNIILMRKDPPVTMEYIYATHILEQAESLGTLIVNKPQSLRDANEKMYTTWFPQCMPPTLVSAKIHALKEFVQQHGIVVFKPLAGMAGLSIFKCTKEDSNLTVILETLTQFGSQYIMAQKYVPEIAQGDKRIFLLEGEPIPYALARIPKAGEIRGNLAAGGTGVGVLLSDRDRWICQQIGPTLKARGLMFVGIDVIGDYLTEINVTSPTCVKEIETAFNLNITNQILDCILEKLRSVI